MTKARDAKHLDMKTKWHLVPLNEDGNPDFKDLGEITHVFTADDIVTLVNRQLYHQKYQRETHRNKYVPKTRGRYDV